MPTSRWRHCVSSSGSTRRPSPRGRALATTQAGSVVEAMPVAAELVTIRTSGDEGGPAAAEGEDKSRFVREIERALLDEEIDLAVHSAKDVPGELPEGLAILGVPARE